VATHAGQRLTGRSEPGADARVSQLVTRHERSLMRVALHWSLCRDDALDAYQRALEIYVRRLDSLDPATEIAWMRVVVKHEALAVRRQRADALPFEEVDYDGRAAEAQRPVDDLLAGRERVRRSAEALQRIKPDEAKALMLKAQGLSYAEIGEALSWTYTKVNRCLTEGRARFLRVYAEIEAGEECERFAPTLAALVAGTASADALLDLRPHIRNCATCRATVRELHATRLGRLGALWPLPAVLAPLRWVAGRFGDASAASPVPGVGPDGGVVLGPPGSPPDPDLSPVEGVTDLYDAIAPLQPPARDAAEAPGRLLDVKAQLYQWLHRLQGSDVATSAQLAASAGGGGRIATVGAVVGLCLSGLGAGTVCVVSGVIDNPFAPERHERVVVRPAPKSADRPAPRRRPNPPTVVATLTPDPSAPKGTARRGERHRSSPANTTPTSHEQTPVSAAPADATQDFSPDTMAPAAPAAPAAAPATGGGEFAP
jgi:RNA polymerase sigma factor (sigma-70 family)